jgi:hypothetical protein
LLTCGGLLLIRLVCGGAWNCGRNHAIEDLVSLIRKALIGEMDAALLAGIMAAQCALSA